MQAELVASEERGDGVDHGLKREGRGPEEGGQRDGAWVRAMGIGRERLPLGVGDGTSLAVAGS